MRILIVTAMVLVSTTALATDKPPVTPPPANVVQNFFANLEARAAANQAQKQAQQQSQAQAQGQSQSQTATGGNANNSNNVQVDNRTRITNAPTVIGNGDTYAASGAVAGVALGIAVPSRAYGRGQIGRNIMEFEGSRAALYTQCGLPDTDRALALLGIACNLHGQDFVEYENGLRLEAYRARKEAAARRKAAAAKPKHRRAKPAPVPTAAPATCQPAATTLICVPR